MVAIRQTIAACNSCCGHAQGCICIERNEREPGPARVLQLAALTTFSALIARPDESTSDIYGGGDSSRPSSSGSRKRRSCGRAAAACSASAVRSSRCAADGERFGRTRLRQETQASFRPTRPHFLSRRYGAAKQSAEKLICIPQANEVRSRNARRRSTARCGV